VHDFSGKNLKKLPSIGRIGSGESGYDEFLLFSGTEVPHCHSL
jgi:hypothetical protein